MRLPRCPAGVLFLFALIVLVVGCGGGAEVADPAPPGLPGQPGQPVADAAEQLVPAGAGALVGDFRVRLAATHDAASDRRATGGPAPVALAVPESGGVADAAGPSAPAAPGGSATLLQEAGVDEDDVVRIDGEWVHTLTPPAADGSQRLVVFRAAADGSSLVEAGSLPLGVGHRFDGLFVDAPRRRLLAIGRPDARLAVSLPAPAEPVTGGASAPVRIVGAPAVAPETSVVDVIDVAIPTAPRRILRLEFDGAIDTARVHHDRLWLVLRSAPRLHGFDRSWSADRVQANQAWLAALTAEDLLPGWWVDSQPRGPLVPETRCFLQPASDGVTGVVTTLAAFDLAAPQAAPLATCLATPVDTVYLAPDALYLATQRHPAVMPMPMPTAPVAVDALAATALRVPDEPVTDVHKFSLSAGAIEYRGSGSVPGRLSGLPDAARFMLSASGRDLRVVTQRDSWRRRDASPARLTVLRDHGEGALREVSSLPNARRPQPIGKPGEQVHAVRFVGTRGYVVTFRRIDPVYVLDLADPEDPRLLGELEVPGFSDRLHPLTPTLLLGVGHDTLDWGGQDLQTGVLVSLIDVADPARPVERARRVIGQRGSRSASDLSAHGTLIRRVEGGFRIALPVQVHEGQAWPADRSAPDAARWRGFSQLAAYRFLVDPAAPALLERPPVVAAVAAQGTGADRQRVGSGQAFDRAIDLGDTTWLWADGRFSGGRW